MGSFQEALDDLTALEAEVLVISVDNVASQRAWAEQNHLRLPLLSDFPRGAVASKYGVLRDDGRTERALFVIDEEGTIRYSYLSPMDQNPGVHGVMNVLEGLKADRDSRTAA